MVTQMYSMVHLVQKSEKLVMLEFYIHKHKNKHPHVYYNTWTENLQTKKNYLEDARV